MITIKQNLGKKSVLATLTIKEGNGELSSYYRPNKTTFKATVVNKDTISDITKLAVASHKAIKQVGRAYKSLQGEILERMFNTEASYLVNLNLLEAVKAVKSKAQLDNLLHDIVMLCAQACAYYQSDIDCNYFQPEGVPLTIPELIKAMSDGASPVLTDKQSTSIKQIAERKQSKDDTSAAWWRILKTLEG